MQPAVSKTKNVWFVQLWEEEKTSWSLGYFMQCKTLAEAKNGTEHFLFFVFLAVNTETNVILLLKKSCDIKFSIF